MQTYLNLLRFPQKRLLISGIILEVEGVAMSKKFTRRHDLKLQTKSFLRAFGG